MSTFEKEFIPYDQALTLKELGLKVEFAFGHYNYDTHKMRDYKNERVTKSFFSAPLYQQAFSWFREKYALEHKILRDSYGCRYQITKVTPTSLEDIDCKGQYSNTSYPKAELECLKKLIEIAKNTNNDI